MFYGGQPILHHLSTQSAGKQFSTFYLAQLAFQISVFCWKKVKMQAGCNIYPTLRNTIVNNFLNIFRIFVIIGITGGLTLAALFHFYTISRYRMSKCQPTKKTLTPKIGSITFKYQLPVHFSEAKLSC